MPKSRRKAPYWLRPLADGAPDITTLRPSDLVKGERFETVGDARQESLRSAALLERHGAPNDFRADLTDCRDGHYDCTKTYCPLCARRYRRWFISELLRLSNSHQLPVCIRVVLLETAPKGSIMDLDLRPYRHSLRKRLERAGLSSTTVIGGFEMVYRAREQEWVLHVNLVIFGGGEAALAKFSAGFAESEFDTPVQSADLHDPAEQLSYVLKFSTYHRPLKQTGPKRSRAVPLNGPEHLELVRWMARYSFSDYLFLFRARVVGAAIKLVNED